MAPARQLRGHQFGNAVLSRFPITHHVEHDLSWKTCEERCLQRVDVDVDGHTLHVYNVHLGTAILERRHQARAARRRSCPTGTSAAPKLVLGDFNEWMRGADDDAAERPAEERRPAELPEAAADLSRPLSAPPPRSHLLRRPAGDRRHRAAAHAPVARRVGSPAAGRGRACRIDTHTQGCWEWKGAPSCWGTRPEVLRGQALEGAGCEEPRVLGVKHSGCSL